LLVIEDTEEILAGLHNFLSKHNYEVFTASDGLEGLKLFEAEKKRFDLIITDVVMPNISGIGLISIIKQKYADTPIIAITGMGKHPEALAIEANADVALKKPFELSELEKYVTDLLSKKR
jgi:DNA-binding response OmpR family regulator